MGRALAKPIASSIRHDDGFREDALPILRQRDAYPLDLPFQLDAGILAHALSHGLAEGLDVGSGGVATVDQEIAVQLGDLRVADHEATAAGGVDELPGLLARRVLEGGAAGAAPDRLRRLTRLGDLVHLGGDRG